MTEINQKSLTKAINTPPEAKNEIAVNKIIGTINANKCDLVKLNKARQEICKLFNDVIPQDIMFLMNDEPKELIEKYSHGLFNKYKTKANLDSDFIILNRIFNFCDNCIQNKKLCTHRMFYASGNNVISDLLKEVFNNMTHIMKQNESVYFLFRKKLKILFTIENNTNTNIIIKFVIYLVLQLKILTIKNASENNIIFKALISNNSYVKDEKLSKIEQYIFKLLQLSNVMKSKNSAKLCNYLANIIDTIIFNMLNLYYNFSLSYELIYKLIDLLPNIEDIADIVDISFDTDTKLTKRIIISDESYNDNVSVSSDTDPKIKIGLQLSKWDTAFNFIKSNENLIVDLHPIRTQTYFCSHRGQFNDLMINCPHLSLFKIFYVLNFNTNNSYILRTLGLYLQHFINTFSETPNITVSSVKLCINNGEIFLMKCNSYKVDKIIEDTLIETFKSVITGYNISSDYKVQYEYCTQCYDQSISKYNL
jgi:hypothetical protein